MSLHRLEELFHAARALTDAERRAAYLAEACGGDAGLRAQVELLLAADASVGRGAGPSTSGDVTGEEPGALVGHYKLLQQIGEGGFGVVWMAEQREPVRRRVALKIIKVGMDTKQVVARFEQERQALALMDHPNIAKVFDAGATATGRPYFVMELVKGVPIVEYCDQEKLDTRARLELFVDVCRAIQHAHQKGIIHRDVKPSNVLVTLHDGRPVPKVIDFGIAKATNAELTSRTLFTEHRQIVGTPAYMSPEQAEMSGLDIDTRSDVYSLGVLLYELLTGTTPFDVQALYEQGLAEMLRVIREVEPEKPSTRVSTLGAAATGAASKRRLDVRRLGTLLRGDLDWIVMRCLEKDRTRRYETASSLALDVQRHLAGEAVDAVPPSTVYRLRKLVRRNKGAVAAASGVAAALLLGAAGFAWQAHATARERDAAVVAREAEAAQRARAETNERRADAVNAFLLDMLGSANVRELGREATIEQALDRAAARVGTAFTDRPELEADVRRILGRTYLSIGALDEAEPHVAAALELDRRLHGERSGELARSLGHHALLQHMRGDPAAACETYARALEITEELDGPESRAALGLRAERALVLMSLGRDAEAAEALRHVLAITTRAAGGADPEALRQRNSLAVALHRLGELDEAEALYREALETGTRAFGAEDPDVLIAQANLGSMLQARGALAEAVTTLESACAGMERVFGDAHPRTAEALEALGRIYRDQGRFQDAAEPLEKALATFVRTQGDGTARVARVQEQLAYVLSRLGQTERAIALQGAANETYAALDGAESRMTLEGRVALATMLVGERDAEAEPIFADVIAVATRAFGADDGIVIRATVGLGVMLMRQDRFADAEPHMRRAVEVSRREEGDDAVNTLINRHNLAVILREAGALEEAEALARDTVERARRVLGPQHANVGIFLSAFGTTLARLERFAEAEDALREALDVARGAYGERHATPAGYELELVRVLLDAGDAEGAEPHALAVVEAFTALRGPADRRTASARAELGRCRALQGRFAEAEPLLLESHAVLVEARPAGHVDIVRAERALTELYSRWDAAAPGAGHAASAARWQAAREASSAAASAAELR